jgi:hypothetical protein
LEREIDRSPRTAWSGRIASARPGLHVLGIGNDPDGIPRRG